MEASQLVSPGPHDRAEEPANLLLPDNDSLPDLLDENLNIVPSDGARAKNPLPADSGSNNTARPVNNDQESEAPLRNINAVESGSGRDAEKEPVPGQGGRRELMEDECESQLGYSFSSRKKWWILAVIFLVQTSMNFNTTLYSNGIPGIAEEFNVSQQVARCGAALFLITYAFGCELWAPWSEEFGRFGVLQLSMTLTNLWTIPVGLAPNIATIFIGRAFGGLSTAGGSVTLGMIADLYDSDSQQYAVAFVVFSSVFGSILGPIIGGFVELLPPKDAWRWCTWIQLIFGASVQLLHFLTVPETRTTILVDKAAKKRREAGLDANVYGPGEMHPFRDRFTYKELMDTWSRAFKMLGTEPIVFWLSMLSGASDAIVFIQVQSMNLIYKQWDFNCWQIGLAFIPIAIGYTIAWAAFFPAFKRNQRQREENPLDEHAQFESRLYPLLWAAPCLPIGLLIFAWTSVGPPLHWIGTMFGTALIGIANYSIYMATIDYMICAYGPYSASATGGNGMARDLLAGILTLPAINLYTSIDVGNGRNYQWASTILAAASAFLLVGAYFVYLKGPSYRRRSPFAEHLAARDEQYLGRQVIVPARSAVVAAEVAAAVEAAQLDGHVQEAENAEDSEGAGNAQEPAGTNPILIPARIHSDNEDWLPGRHTFGALSPQGSYMASVHAASRRQSRQASRNASANTSRRNSHQEGSLNVSAVSIAERLAERLTNLNAVIDESFINNNN